MCKVCTTCKGIMNYDPYFEAEVCANCGKMERNKSKNLQKGDGSANSGSKNYKATLGSCCNIG